MIPAELGILVSVLRGSGIRQIPLDLSGSRQFGGEPVSQAQLLVPVPVGAGAPELAYFCRKRSTRPAVSSRRCLPVKNGWQTEHTSVWISDCVERVWKVLPQAHLTVAVAYCGWMSDFMALGAERL